MKEFNLDELGEPAKAPKITTNLFSFKTFRSPDKINPNKKELFFIYYPTLLQNLFAEYEIPNPETDSQEQYQSFLSNLNPIKSYKEIRDANISFYDYSCLLMEQRKNDSSKKPLDVEPPELLSEEVYLQIWQQLFIQIVTQQSAIIRQICLQLIVTQFYIQNKTRLELSDVAKLTVVIPTVLIDWLRAWKYSKCGGRMYGVRNLGIQDFRRVEQTLCCYVPGEVSHIENIMASEYKEKSTRNLLRTESTTEFTSETEIENLNDTTTAERNELSSEIAKELQKDKSFDVSGSVTVNKGLTKNFGMSANVSTGYNSSSSSAQSNTEAKNYAKEITERALERVVQKTSEKRTYKMIKEFEEINKHGFDNRGGDKHITGVYRWVDKIYDNELVNYGKRLVLEMDVPHPAMLYKKAMEWKKKGSEPDPLTPPKTLGELGINKYDDVDEAKALEAADYYGITINGFEEKSETLTTSFQNEVKHVTSTVIDTKEAIAIPSGLVAKNMTIYLSFRYQSLDNTGSFCTVKVNGEDFKRGDFTHSGGKRSDDHTFVKDFSPKVSGAMSFSVAYRKVYDYSGTVIITCVSDPAMYTEWQQETYNQLKKAYQNKLNEYNEELKQQKAEQEAKADQSGNENYSNTALNRLIEERELKRACIELMTKPFCYDMGHSFMNCMTYSCATSCEDDQEISANIPQIVQNEMLEQYARFAKFFETAFQWEIFSYIFYPYYYNEKCRWYELLQTKNPDPIFEAFLQSGMAKILVPVRPQFEKAVMWYIETGEVYTEGDLLIPETDDARYETLLGDLGDQDKVTVEGTWQTRIPSTLTIIQGQTTCYDDTKGLPCDCEGTSPFRLENFILVAKDDKPKDDEVNEDEE